MTKTKEQKKARFGVRLISWLIDIVILTIVTAALERILIFPPFGQGLWTSFSFLSGALYFILFWVNWNGQTVGKKLLKLKVVRKDGKSLDYQTAIIRYLGYILSAIVFYLGYFWIIWDKEKQGWHDKIAGTWVVEE